MIVFIPDGEGQTWTICVQCSIEQLTVLYGQESNVDLFQMELTLVRSTPNGEGALSSLLICSTLHLTAINSQEQPALFMVTEREKIKTNQDQRSNEIAVIERSELH